MLNQGPHSKFLSGGVGGGGEAIFGADILVKLFFV